MRTAFVIFASSLVATSFASTPVVKTITAKAIVPTECSKCPGGHGDLIVTYSDGSKETLSKYGMATQARVASDLRTVGWVATTHQSRSDIGGGSGVYTLAAKLFLYRDGKQLASIAPGNAVVKDWGFRSNNTKVAIHSSPLQKGDAYTLVDLATGKEAASYSPVDGKAPDWVTGLK